MVAIKLECPDCDKTIINALDRKTIPLSCPTCYDQFSQQKILSVALTKTIFPMIGGRVAKKKNIHSLAFSDMISEKCWKEETPDSSRLECLARFSNQGFIKNPAMKKNYELFQFCFGLVSSELIVFVVGPENKKTFKYYTKEEFESKFPSLARKDYKNLYLMPHDVNTEENYPTEAGMKYYHLPNVDKFLDGAKIFEEFGEFVFNSLQKNES